MIKRSDLILTSLLLVAIFGVLLPNVSAGPVADVGDIVRSTLDAAVEIGEPILRYIIGDAIGSTNATGYSSGEMFFMKVLFYVLLIIVISAVLRRIPNFEGRNGLTFFIALIISTIAIRFIGNSDLINGVLLPYGTMGVAILIIIPSALLFWGVYALEWGGAARRMVLAVWLVCLVVLWSYNYDSFGDVMNTIYWGLVIVFVLAFLFDHGIKNFFGTHELARFRLRARNQAIARLQAEYLNILNVNSPEANARRIDIETNLRRLGARFTP